ncbi:hypothetical protein [Nocardia australiensis]|uniref:hypothetical protein n=1 Tax=Nocardia australiensis TaxID=2887191 RepID=UPI001D13C47D|nr:hypothetical protein [Nocardia australiensis]
MATRSVPQPPFSPELLADLHADNIAPDLGAQLWPEVQRDADALRFLHSLDEVSARLRTLGREDHIIHSMPGEVSARLEQFVDGLDAAEEPTEQVATVHHLPFTTAAPETSVTPTVSTLEQPAIEREEPPLAVPIELADRRQRRLLRWLAAAAAAVAVIACAAVAVESLRDRQVAPTAQPTHGNVELGDNLNATAALTALGRNDVTGSLGSPTSLNRCVHANGLDRTVLGSTNTSFKGTEAVLILLTGPRPHKITALVVGIGCTTDDPQQLAMTDIG